MLDAQNYLRRKNKRLMIIDLQVSAKHHADYVISGDGEASPCRPVYLSIRQWKQIPQQLQREASEKSQNRKNAWMILLNKTNLVRFLLSILCTDKIYIPLSISEKGVHISTVIEFFNSISKFSRGEYDQSVHFSKSKVQHNFSLTKQSLLGKKLPS